MYYVYMVTCGDSSLYTGVAADVRKRIRQHCERAPEAAKYTKSHPVNGVAAVWEAPDKVSAMRLEYRIKRLRRADKMRLAASRGPVSEFIPDLDGSLYRRADVTLADCING